MASRSRDEAFEALFDSCFARAVAVARRIVRDGAVAEDLAAEAFARAFAHWPRLRDEPGREGWVLRVTANLAIDVTRRRPAYLRGRQAPDLGDEVAVRLALAAALRSLPKQQRSVVVLRYLADLSEAETARALGIAPGTVKAHLHRAIGRMRRHMNRNEDEISLALQQP